MPELRLNMVNGHCYFEENRNSLDKMKKREARFEVDAPNALFLSQAEQKNLPIDDMPKLI
jgi:hypothetical protein